MRLDLSQCQGAPRTARQTNVVIFHLAQPDGLPTFSTVKNNELISEPSHWKYAYNH